MGEDDDGLLLVVEEGVEVQLARHKQVRHVGVRQVLLVHREVGGVLPHLDAVWICGVLNLGLPLLHFVVLASDSHGFL